VVGGRRGVRKGVCAGRSRGAGGGRGGRLWHGVPGGEPVAPATPPALDVPAVPDRALRAEERGQSDARLSQGEGVATQAWRAPAARRDGGRMRALRLLGPVLAVVLAGCAAQEPPRPMPRRPPPEPPKPTGNAKYQRDL